MESKPTELTVDLFRIKPLEWEWLTVNDIKFLNANSPVGNLNWRIYELTTGWHLNPSGKSGIDCASPEEGKQLAEQHWNEYLQQALQPFPLTSFSLRPVAQALYDKGCGHVMDVDEIEAILGHGLAECVPVETNE